MVIQLVGWMQIQDNPEAFYTTPVSLTVGVPDMLTYTIRRLPGTTLRDLEMDLEGAMHVDTELESSVLSI